MQLERFVRLLTVCTFLVVLIPRPAFAQQEPSPIDVQLVVPAQVGPGQLFEIQIKYDAVDLNAGADLNYNVFGPCRIWSRSPEPPNPIVNTWKPTPDTARGTIKIQIQVDQGTDGQTIRHQVEVRWGPKVRVFEATTAIKYIPPTATPTFTPRPTRPPATPTPTQPAATTAAPARVVLSRSNLVDASGNTVSAAQVNQTLGLDVRYTSSVALENVRLIIRFEPDVVNVDNSVYIDGNYVIELPTLNAVPQETSLFTSPLSVHLRPFAEGGEAYTLQATVSLVQGETTLAETKVPPVQVGQPATVEMTASVEAEVVKSGGGIIVHVVCVNPGTVPVKWLKLQIEGLPEGFVLTPSEQSIDLLEPNGGRVERLFTVHVPKEFSGLLTFNAVGLLDEMRIESAPVTVELAPPSKLTLDAAAGQTEVKAGQVVYVNVMCTNEGRLAAEQVTVRLIDISGSLGVLFQDVGDIPPGESRRVVFVVEIPQDFPASADLALAAQAVAADGTVSQSQAVRVSVTCVPALALEIKSPDVRVRAGQPAQVVVGVINSSQCAARNITVAMVGLPQGFGQPAPQNLAELGPGQTRLLNFGLNPPKNYHGIAAFNIQAGADGGVIAPTVSGKLEVIEAVPRSFVILFWSLVIIALIAIVVGLTMYFKNR